MTDSLSSSITAPVPDPTFATIPEALRHAASLWPDAEAVVIGEVRLTYRTLAERVAVAAANLYRLGLRPGEHIAICMGNTPEWVVAAYAASCIGAVVVPVNTRFKADELRYCLEQSDAVFLVIADRFLKIDFIDMLRQVMPGVDAGLPDAALPQLRTVIVLGNEVPRGALPHAELARTPVPPAPAEAAPGPQDIALIQYTSGTTSYPKGVMLTHRSMTLDAWHLGKRIGLRAGDRYFSGRPLFHVAGTTLSMLASVASGACYLTTPSFDVTEVLRTMEKERCTVTSGNDTMFIMMMNHPDFDASKLVLRAAWAAANTEVLRQIVEKMSIPDLCTGYGLSESSPNSAMGPYYDDLEKRLAGYAFPLPGVEVRIFDPDTGAEVPPGTQGELCIRGWNVMRGYYKMPEHTARAIDAQGWLHTGDLGMADADGRVRFVDRLKDMFRVGGENVAPAEVENVLNAHPAVHQAQVVGVPDPRLMQVPAAYVILKAGAKADADELIAWCKERSAAFKVPRYVRFVDSFDAIGMTGSAKIQRNKLRAHALADLGLGG